MNRPISLFFTTTDLQRRTTSEAGDCISPMLFNIHLKPLRDTIQGLDVGAINRWMTPNCTSPCHAAWRRSLCPQCLSVSSKKQKKRMLRSLIKKGIVNWLCFWSPCTDLSPLSQAYNLTAEQPIGTILALHSRFNFLYRKCLTIFPLNMKSL